jgi:hypothetical protein
VLLVVGSARVHPRARGGRARADDSGPCRWAWTGDFHRAPGWQHQPHRWASIESHRAGCWVPRIMATPRMPSLIPRRPGLVHYAFAAAIGWATSYYTFQPLLEQQVRHRVGSAMPAVLLPAVSKQTAAPCLPGWLAGRTLTSALLRRCRHSSERLGG